MSQPDVGGNPYELIDARREALDMTWLELADHAGVSRTTFLNIRDGRPPRKTTRWKIEDALQLPRGSLSGKKLDSVEHASPAEEVTPPAIPPLSAPQVEWMRAVLARAEEIHAEAGREVADAYVEQMIRRRGDALRQQSEDAGTTESRARDIG